MSNQIYFRKNIHYFSAFAVVTQDDSVKRSSNIRGFIFHRQASLILHKVGESKLKFKIQFLMFPKKN